LYGISTAANLSLSSLKYLKLPVWCIILISMWFLAVRQKLAFFVSENCFFHEFWKCTADAKTKTVSFLMSPEGILLYRYYTPQWSIGILFWPTTPSPKQLYTSIIVRYSIITWFENSRNFPICFAIYPFVYFRLPGRRITGEVNTSHFGVQVLLSIFRVLWV